MSETRRAAPRSVGGTQVEINVVWSTSPTAYTTCETYEYSVQIPVPPTVGSGTWKFPARECPGGLDFGVRWLSDTRFAFISEDIRDWQYQGWSSLSFPIPRRILLALSAPYYPGGVGQQGYYLELRTRARGNNNHPDKAYYGIVALDNKLPLRAAFLRDRKKVSAKCWKAFSPIIFGSAATNATIIISDS
jgi:hypothetical protein